MKALAFIVFVFAVLQTTTADRFEKLCRLFPDGTTIAKPGSEYEYVECYQGLGKTHVCNEPKVFDPTKRSCIEKQVTANNPCNNKDNVWVADPRSCEGFYYCRNSEAMEGFCPNGYHFNPTSQMCTFKETSTCFEAPNFCTLLPSPTKFVDESQCNQYYECKGSGDPKKNKCKDTTYFDRNTQNCIDSTKIVTCRAHPIPSGICKKGPGLKSDQATCRGFFKCADLGIVDDKQPQWFQCPAGKFFSEQDQNCVPPTDVFCKYNRCDGRGDLLVTSSTSDCHNYLVCKNNLVVEEKSCPLDMFFDEYLQSCVRYPIYHKCCDGTPFTKV